MVYRGEILGRRCGFTLVELLVALSIVVILVAFLFQGLSRAQKRVEVVQVINRLKQLQAANDLYSSDHQGQYVPWSVFNEDGKSPPGKHWLKNPAYTQYLLGDSAFEGKNFNMNWPQNLLDPKMNKIRGKHSRFSHAMNGCFGYTMGVAFVRNGRLIRGNAWGIPNTHAHRASTLGNPSATFSFCTAQDWLVKYSKRFAYDAEGEKTGKPQHNQAVAYRYDGKAYFVYFDGHVEGKTQKDIREIDERSGGGNRGIRSLFWTGNDPDPVR